MKRIICDQCRTEATPNEYGLAPDGWISVGIRGVYRDNADYCSKPCAVDALSAATPVQAVERTIEEAERGVPAIA